MNRSLDRFDGDSCYTSGPDSALLFDDFAVSCCGQSCEVVDVPGVVYSHVSDVLLKRGVMGSPILEAPGLEAVSGSDSPSISCAAGVLNNSIHRELLDPVVFKRLTGARIFCAGLEG